MTTKPKSIYVDNTDLLREWHDWVASGETPESRTISDELARMMMTIAERILQSRHFCGYSQATREDMAQEAILKMIRNLRNYRADKGTLFSYLSRICFCSNATYLKKHYRRRNTEREMSLSAIEQAPQTGRRRAFVRAMRAKVEEYH